jgi:hypothetical protein
MNLLLPEVIYGDLLTSSALVGGWHRNSYVELMLYKHENRYNWNRKRAMGKEGFKELRTCTIGWSFQSSQIYSHRHNLRALIRTNFLCMIFSRKLYFISSELQLSWVPELVRARQVNHICKEPSCFNFWDTVWMGNMEGCQWRADLINSLLWSEPGQMLGCSICCFLPCILLREVAIIMTSVQEE